MGCGASTQTTSVAAPSGGSTQKAPASRPGKNPYEGTVSKKDDPKELNNSNTIDRELDKARQQEELKVKLLLLGAGESGKSTIFKQMRILHGAPRTDDDLRMYGVVVRSNIITAMRKLLQHLRNLGLEEKLARESTAVDGETQLSGMSPKEAYDLLMAHFVDNTGNSDDLHTHSEDSKDWVGTSPRAKLGANNDAKQFMQLWKPIKTVWEVRQTYS